MRRMGAAIGAVLALGLAMAPAAAQTPKPDPAVDFKVVKTIGTRRAFAVFLQVHPTGPYADLARQELAKLTTPPEHGRKTEPNWGDHMFIQQLMDKQRR